jgi:hypothetical protein
VSTFALQILAIALVALHLRGSLKVSVGLLIAGTFFIPGAILFPDAPAYLFVLRLGLWAASAGMLVRAASGEIPFSALRPSRALVALGLFVVVAYVFGVAGGPYPSRSESAFELWLLLVDQLLFLWAATVAVRVLGFRFVALTAVSAVVGVACIAIVERLTGASYAHWWFRHQRLFALAGQQLERRGSNMRVRATGEFALQFAWVLAFFLPLLAVFAVRAKRVVALAAPCVVALAIVLTVTRSVFAGLVAGGVCLVLFARGDRRIIGGLAAAALAAGVLYLAADAVRSPYQAADPESEAVRTRRLSVLTEELARRPWTGVGLDGAVQRGIDSTDSALLATYAGVGVIGVAALAGALGTAGFTALAAGSIADATLAPLAGAVLGGVAAGGLAMFAFDSLSGPMASWNLWLLAALAVGLYEEAAAARAGPLRPRLIRLSRRRLMLPAAGLVIGGVVALTAPTHIAVQLRIFTLSPTYLTRTESGHADFVGRVMVQATCDAAKSALDLTSSASLDCFDPLRAGPGAGTVRIEARSTAELAGAQDTFTTVAKRVHAATRISVVTPPRRARSTWARTAPLTLPLLFGEAALLLPAIRFGRRRAGATGRPVAGRRTPAFR